VNEPRQRPRASGNEDCRQSDRRGILVPFPAALEPSLRFRGNIKEVKQRVYYPWQSDLSIQKRDQRRQERGDESCYGQHQPALQRSRLRLCRPTFQVLAGLGWLEFAPRGADSLLAAASLRAGHRFTIVTDGRGIRDDV